MVVLGERRALVLRVVRLPGRIAEQEVIVDELDMATVQTAMVC